MQQQNQVSNYKWRNTYKLLIISHKWIHNQNVMQMQCSNKNSHHTHHTYKQWTYQWADVSCSRWSTCLEPYKLATSAKHSALNTHSVNRSFVRPAHTFTHSHLRFIELDLIYRIRILCLNPHSLLESEFFVRIHILLFYSFVLC